MELKEQPFAPTLAHKLGDVPHVSGLLRRLAQLSGTGERVAERLLKVAIARGAKHTPGPIKSSAAASPGW